MLMFISNVFYIQTHKFLFMPAILCFYNICYITVLGSNAFDESGFHLELRIISRMVITTFRTYTIIFSFNTPGSLATKGLKEFPQTMGMHRAADVLGSLPMKVPYQYENQF